MEKQNKTKKPQTKQPRICYSAKNKVFLQNNRKMPKKIQNSGFTGQI